MIGIYVHIPFCVRKCLYCDFVSYVTTEEVRAAYVARLLKDIAEADVKETVDTVYIGGGTPSVLEAKDICMIMDAIRERFALTDDCECSMEVNPGTVSTEKLISYRKAGINRLSIGLQSCDDKELETLGRIHSCEMFLDAYRMAREAGFENINIDLMSAIPGQTKESYKETLQKVLQLKPEHISAYSLIVEEGTPFADMELNLASEEDERCMYYETDRLLSDAGYVRYEISNYALPGCECRHNIRYWTGKEYLGFGVAAASFYKGCRSKNAAGLDAYIANGPESEESVMLTDEDAMEEFFYLGLRMCGGVEEEAFLRRFGMYPQEVYGDVLEKHVRDGLLVREDGRIRLTSRGIDVSNYVLCDFIL